jgi:hypothetical protein
MNSPGKVIKPEDVTEADFNNYIATAADALSAFDYEIKSMKHQKTKVRYYSLINSTSDPLTQIATIHTPEEIGFVKRLLDAMFETHNTKRKEVMAVTGMQALEKKIIKASNERRESSTQVDKGLTVQEAERCLGALVTEGWFEHSREGYYSLSPRSLMELRAWLVDMYNDDDDPEEWQAIKFCEACKEIVTVGQRCADLDCHCRLHDICQSYWNSRPNKNCPRCDKEWDEKQFVGQRVVTKTDEYLREKRRSNNGRRARQEENGVEDEPEEEPEEGDGDDDD